MAMMIVRTRTSGEVGTLRQLAWVVLSFVSSIKLCAFYQVVWVVLSCKKLNELVAWVVLSCAAVGANCDHHHTGGGSKHQLWSLDSLSSSQIIIVIITTLSSWWNRMRQWEAVWSITTTTKTKITTVTSIIFMMRKVAAVRSSLDRQTGLILTGPTCTGKSTILKQVSLHHHCCWCCFCC